MTQKSIRDYEKKLMKECIEDAEKVIGPKSPAAVAYIATSFFRLRRKSNNF
ncbi:MAG: hypothetical protein KAW41_01520 [Candidatus Diapherotrites archaeon]|nr:hypothetical protein [Candidatus Diapherotrites archaeon]